MCTLTLLGAKFFGDREMKESIDREGWGIYIFGVLADIGTYTVYFTVSSFIAEVL